MRYILSLIILISFSAIAQRTTVKTVRQTLPGAKGPDTVWVTGRSQTTTVHVYKDPGTIPPPVNQLPNVGAGSAQTITLPVNMVTLNGVASDPDGTIVSYSWSKVSGGNANIETPSTPSTNVTGLNEGAYVFKLSATDNSGGTGSANVLVTVNPVVVIPQPPSGDIIAEGYGQNAKGGEGKPIYHVKTVADFNSAIGSNRQVIFDNNLSFTARIDLIGISYLTIDGNGFDIVINNNNNGDGISFDGANTHHCILKGVNVTNAGNDGINVLDGSHDILITNCSSYLNRDGNIDVAGGINVTVQWCILGGGGTGWAGDMLITATNVTAHHNLYSPATPNEVGERCPLVHCNYTCNGQSATAVNADFRNNVIWKFGRANGTGSGYGTAICYTAHANVINNYYYTAGSGSPTSTSDGYGGGATGVAYMAGNVSGNGVNANAPSNHAVYPVPPVVTQDACTAARLVLAQAGPRPLNATNQKLINAVLLTGCP